MADKQLARSADVDPNAFPDEDPLSELARIVGYDNRPALQQLQELERHRESVRYDPIVDLEEELMREFEAYDTPAAPEPVAPLQAIVEPVPVAAQSHAQPVFAPQPMQQAPRHVEPTFDAQPEPAVHAFSEPVRSEPRPADVRHSEPAIDLGDELEMSLGSAAEPVHVPQMPVAPVPAVRAHVDPLLDTVESFAVPNPPVRPAVATEAARKNNFPFTPNFSRATPVALSTGANRTFATPLPPAPAAPVMPAPVAAAPVVAAPVMKAPVAQASSAPAANVQALSAAAPRAPSVQAPAAVAAAFVAPPIAAAAVQPMPVAAAEPEPDFNFDDFEIDLSDIDIELDMAADEVAAIEEPVEAFTEAELPFDPSMIAEADYGVAATGEIDVPQLPVIEEQNLQLDSGDYDLDIDAEMAQIFSAGRQESERGHSGAAAAAAVGIAGAAAPARSSHEEFADFERAMEEDFRRSMSQRQEVIGQGDRSAEPAYGNDNDARPRGKLFLLAGAAAIVLIAGGVGAYTMMGNVGSSFAGGEPQIILADKAPTKMVPLEKGGKTVPNQDKAVYDRVAGAQEEAPQQGTLVSSTEEPMDVVQRTLTPESLPLEGANGLDGLPADDEGADRLMPDDGDAQASAAAEDAAPAVAPRKVRTMIVRPDGTLVAREDLAPEEAPVVAAVAPAAKTLKASTPNTPALATPAQDEVAALAAAADATVSNASAETAKAQPLPEARPQTKPIETAKATTRKPVDTFATPTTTATTPASVPAEPSPVQTASIAPGSYVVQVASLPSEAEAQKSYKSLSGKFGSVIAGRGVDIKKAEIAGKGTYYRVRIPAGSRDEANSLCSRLKSAGGSCLVTR
ncbi:sporulation related protein [Rhizobium sp. PP-F2F-G48]|nr:SPOR domain-containing protein [Rhizobium sp. PP-F2F-G48]TCM57310.1 sporulation related protein [Rhizobium sp. PP-F2F-G48]